MAKNQFTWAQAARDVFNKAISAGQLPVLIFGLIVALLVWKTPEEDISTVWDLVAGLLLPRAGLGYSLTGASIAMWFLHARRIRRVTEREIRRLSDQRTEEQQPHFKKKLPSSDAVRPDKEASNG